MFKTDIAMAPAVIENVVITVPTLDNYCTV